MESPPSITDTELTIVEENAETIRRNGSVRARRRAKRAAALERQVREIARLRELLRRERLEEAFVGGVDASLNLVS